MRSPSRGVSMSSPTHPTSDPTIEEVLDAFLAAQETRLSRKSFRKYSSIIQLFTHSLDKYAYMGLGGKEARTFDHHYKLDGEAHREFCQVLGPEHIPDNVGEFLGYFMPRKVYASRELEQAAGTTIRRLARWLHQHGHIGVEERDGMVLESKD